MMGKGRNRVAHTDCMRAAGAADRLNPGYDSFQMLDCPAGNDAEKTRRKTLLCSKQLTRRNVLKASAAALALAPPRASAQANYPARPVRVVIPYPPAGGADTVGRLLFQKLGEMWGAQFVIDNRGGAGGTIAAAAVAKAERDGYTLMFDATAHSVNPSLYANLSYDTVKDFQPIFLAALIANLLVVNKSVEAQSVADVIALAKATPGGLDWASSGNGTVQHLALEMFRHRAGININHIPYRGGGPALNDLIAGQVKFFFSNAAASVGHVQSGTIKCIAHTGKGRLAALPEVPSVAETLPGFEAYEWQGLFAPAGIPAPIVDKLNAGMNAVLRQPDMIERLKQLNVESRENSPQEFRAFVAAEIEKWRNVVREANIRLG